MLLFNALYIDPSAVSGILVGITAAIAALGATFIVVWRNLKKKVKKTLHIDENAGKEVEEDVVITEDVSEEPAKEENKD